VTPFQLPPELVRLLRVYHYTAIYVCVMVTLIVILLAVRVVHEM
jgi:hypothetical protein